MQERINDLKGIYSSNSTINNTREIPWIFPCLFTNGKDDNGKDIEVTSDSVPTDNGKIKMTFNMCAYHELYGKEHASVMITMFMIVNGELYDFSLGDYTSENGILTMELPTNTEFIAPFESQTLNMQKGDNEFEVITLGYYPEHDSYLPDQQFASYFTSVNDYCGNSIITVPVEKDIADISVETIDGKTEKEIQTYLPDISVFSINDRLKSRDAEGYTTIKQSAQLSFPLLNPRYSNQLCSCSQICVTMCNGKPLNVWNQKPYIFINMTESELMKSIPMKTNFQAKDKVNLKLVTIPVTKGQIVTSYVNSYSFPLVFDE